MLVMAIAIGLVIAASGCRVFTAPDVPATLQAQNTAYVEEATQLAADFQTQQVAVRASAQAGVVTVAAMDSINRQLALTARAIVPNTPERQIGIAPGAEAFSATQAPSDLSAIVAATPPPGGAVVPTTVVDSPFIDTGVSQGVRETDGCADQFVTQFAPTASRVYVNTRARRVSAGTLMAAEWSFAGQLVAQDSFTISEDATDFCIWFFLDAARVPFTPGQWSVTLTANGSPVGPAVAFTISES